MEKVFAYLRKLLSLRKESSGLPPALFSKFLSYILLAFVFCALTIAFGLTYRSPRVMMFPGLCAVIMFVLAFSFKAIVYSTGIRKVVGRCIDHKDGILKNPIRRRGADYFIVETVSEVIKVPSSKRSNVPPLDSLVELYISPDSYSYNSGGVTVYSSIYGYTVIAEAGVEA